MLVVQVTVVVVKGMTVVGDTEKNDEVWRKEKEERKKKKKKKKRKKGKKEKDEMGNLYLLTLSFS